MPPSTTPVSHRIRRVGRRTDCEIPSHRCRTGLHLSTPGCRGGWKKKIPQLSPISLTRSTGLAVRTACLLIFLYIIPHLFNILVELISFQFHICSLRHFLCFNLDTKFLNIMFSNIEAFLCLETSWRPAYLYQWHLAYLMRIDFCLKLKSLC